MTRRSTSTASSSTRPTPRSASTTTACSTATASSRASASTPARSSASASTSTASTSRPGHRARNPAVAASEMIEAVDDTVKANNKLDGYIRLVVTRGAGTLGLDPRKTCDPQVIIIVDDISLYPPELYENGLEIITAVDDPQPPERAQPAHQVAQLPQQHPRQDRGHPRRLPRSADAQPQGRGRRVHRRQHLPRQAAACCRRRRPTPASSKASRATPSSSWPEAAGIPLRGDDADAARRLHRRRVLPDRHGRRGHPRDRSATAAPIGTGKPGPITKQLREAFMRLTRE